MGNILTDIECELSLVGPLRQPRDHHVCVADGLHLVDVVALDDLVELGVELVEKVDDLQGRRLGAHRGEADDVRKVDGDVGERLGLHGHSMGQLPVTSLQNESNIHDGCFDVYKSVEKLLYRCTG